MSESILFRIQRDSVHTLAETVRSWTEQPVNSTRAGEVEEVLRVCLRWPEAFAELWETLWRKAVANQIDDYQQTGEQLLDLLDRALSVLNPLTDQVRDQERQGRRLRGAAQLDPAREELRRLRQHYQERWPWLNETIIQEALAEYARGEAHSVRELLDELQGKSQ